MKIRGILCAAVIVAVISGCEQPEQTVRYYREISFMTEPAGRPEVSVPSAMPPVSGGAMMPDLPPEMQTPPLPLQWDTPEGWSVAAGSGMRVATFTVSGQECTILTFPGDVGGDEANIRRWFGQLGVDIANDTLRSFVMNPRTIRTVGGYDCRLFDFADALPDGSPKSILAGIIPVGDQTAFVKLMGDAAVLQQEKAAFEALCASIRMENVKAAY